MRRIAVDANAPEPESIRIAAAAIRRSGLVIIPTDTLYGLAANPFDRVAVGRITLAKGRPSDRAIALIAADRTQIARQLGPLSTAGQRLAERFWPGPLTLLLRAPDSLAPEVTAGTDTIGVRVPNHPVSLALCRECGYPLTATSANSSGQPPSADPEVVARVFAPAAAAAGAPVDVLVDAGTTPGGAPSTVVDLTGRDIRLVRPGAIAWEDIQSCLQTERG